MKKLKRLSTTNINTPTHLTSIQVPQYTEEVDAITTEGVKTEFNGCLGPIAVPLTLPPVMSQLQTNSSSTQQLNKNELVLPYSNATSSTPTTLNNSSPTTSSNNTSLKQGTTFTSHTDFVVAVQEYSTRNGFTMRLNTVKRNREGVVRWREIVCSRSGAPSSKKSGIKPIRNRPSQRCDCPFLIRASINGITGLWEIISTNFDHNHDINID